MALSIHGQMDCRLTTRGGEPAVEWSWDGNAEMDPAFEIATWNSSGGEG